MYYNLAKTAELLGLNTGDVNRLREQGKLRAFKDGADWKFRKEEVEQYLTKMEVAQSDNQFAEALGAVNKIIRIDPKAGHGGGKPISKVLEEQADIYSFILYNMGLTYPKEAK